MQESRLEHDLVVSNARIFDGEKLLDGLHSVGIAKGRISFLNPSPTSARKEIDAAGRFLMPGLIDCHLHLLNMWTALDEASMAADINGELKTRLRAFLRRVSPPSSQSAILKTTSCGYATCSP